MFQSTRELARTVLRLLDEREQESRVKLKWLCGEIRKGLDSGPATPLDLEEIKRLGRERMHAVNGTPP
ncbi:ribbon-helix-helix domain-containing protein [Fimbriiglobus ruber]|uniref:Uncharacterized protein n=1 Tax=Fimbriiglobus ruber TaxID=1908690 RepID=A0A225DEV2_9BACT|nr:CopG family transcriptional regulator [Fimbriiglobus ruber]OWK34915.1 hypothetical protein FRUB_09757 [Fimbriiglobus ruber]